MAVQQKKQDPESVRIQDLSIPDKEYPITAKKVIDRSKSVVKIYDFIGPDGKVKEKELKALGKVKLEYLKNKRKFNQQRFSSYYDPDRNFVWGSYLDAEKTELRSYLIDKTEKTLDLSKETDYKMFLAFMTEPFVMGSLNQRDVAIWKVICITEKAKEDYEKSDNIITATSALRDLTDVQIKNLGIVLGLIAFESMDKKEQITMLAKIAVENPESILKAIKNEDAEIILLLDQAKRSGVIVEDAGIFKYERYELGTTSEQAIRFLKKNENVANLIRSEITE